ncbi:hypothetical protein DL93DRAFT_2161556 [Clavulina sp. PMI_390]|nr:hypothetical protein DL93DRAFT_2161556 [Clavulina sp. PMI_390]
MHEAHKIGSYWKKIGNGYEDRANCHCRELDTMDHVLFTCPQGAGQYIWPAVWKLLREKGVEWPREARTVDVLTSAFAEFKARNGGPRLWKFRNERVIGRDDGEGDKPHRVTRREAVRALARVLNQRLSDDQRLANRVKYGNKALSRDVVMSTWSGVLYNEACLPPDWLRQPGVLVGLVIPRFRGLGQGGT